MVSRTRDNIGNKLAELAALRDRRILVEQAIRSLEAIRNRRKGRMARKAS